MCNCNGIHELSNFAADIEHTRNDAFYISLVTETASYAEMMNLILAQ